MDLLAVDFRPALVVVAVEVLPLVGDEAVVVLEGVGFALEEGVEGWRRERERERERESEKKQKSLACSREGEKMTRKLSKN